MDAEEAQRLLGDWLARWRVQVGVSQRKLAAMAGIDQGGLSRVEHGRQLLGRRDVWSVIMDECAFAEVARSPARRHGQRRL